MYSGFDCMELCNQVLDLIKQDREYWVHIASVVLPLCPQNFDDWLTQMENLLTPCDKMFLFVLSKAHLLSYCSIQPKTSMVHNSKH